MKFDRWLDEQIIRGNPFVMAGLAIIPVLALYGFAGAVCLALEAIRRAVGLLLGS